MARLAQSLATLLLGIIFVSVGGSALAATPATPSAGRQTTYTDPFAYCAAVGTIDRPDGRYVGPTVPTRVAEGLRDAFHLPSSHPIEPFQIGTYWRCMDGQLYACHVGANLPCLEQADTSRTPSKAMVEFCAAQPEADVIPAAVTGRATVYLWRCEGGRPTIVRQVDQPDARGFLKAYWHPISP